MSGEVFALPGAAPSASAIKLYARETAGFAERLAKTVELLQEAVLDHGDGLLQSSSLGAEDMVITDLIARHKLPIAIATLDTGRLHAETLALLPQIEARYGLKVAVYSPVNDAVVTFVRVRGADAMYESLALRKECCAIRKLEPLSRMLDGRTAWITGLRREQSSNRAVVPFSEPDHQGRTKLNVLADWSWADVWHYIATYDLPFNALHDQFMPSIGCAPCTRAISVGEDFRSGRWWWESEDAKECGLHKSHSNEELKTGASA
ncbi:phosphoadenylyl-sulfate reductase [Roseateles oligotrophus]|uniref:Adenosine 5'-phosphosulfate reductase n=1 Tax=Roseateles oligotrophus TaxID=1769250 RepID=A0ABT2YJ93_9BURK|nr:phosphoadenylyl-sulfate reductase [Roseateles oligotrophus]MCV2370128.1 phosphoadenylyl-sulfate reductase [Roseateles oligotrophus]